MNIVISRRTLKSIGWALAFLVDVWVGGALLSKISGTSGYPLAPTIITLSVVGLVCALSSIVTFLDGR